MLICVPPIEGERSRPIRVFPDYKVRYINRLFLVLMFFQLPDVLLNVIIRLFQMMLWWLLFRSYKKYSSSFTLLKLDRRRLPIIADLAIHHLPRWFVCFKLLTFQVWVILSWQDLGYFVLSWLLVDLYCRKF